MRTTTTTLLLLLASHGGAFAERVVCNALADCDAMIRTSPGLALYERRGCIHLSRRDLDKAIADFTAAIGIEPGRSFSLYGRGMARLMSGDAAGQNEMEAAIMLQRNIVEEFKTCGAN
jgi:hypothetical protein